MFSRVTAAVLVGAALALSGCAVLPQPPATAPSPEPAPTSGQKSSAPPIGFSAAERAAVRVRNVTCAGVGSGSGFALAEDLLVTNAHVIEGASVLQLNTYDGREIEVDASAAATVADLALVHTAQPLPQLLPIAEADPVVGDEISVAGYPGGGQLRTSTGTVLGYTDDQLGVNVDEVFATDAQVQPGSSGSAVVDVDGQVVGVVYAASAQGLAYAVPISALHALWDQPGAFVPLEPCH